MGGVIGIAGGWAGVGVCIVGEEAEEKELLLEIYDFFQ